MHRNRLVAAAAVAIGLRVLAVTAQTSPTCTSLAAAKQSTYGFHPSKLSASERKSKGAAMDRFWNQVKAAGPDGLACMAKFIAGEKADTYFLFDGASMLATFDTSGTSDASIISGLARTDLSDLDAEGFIDVALQVSKRNGDIGPAAHNYMNATEVTTYLPAHGGYKLDRIPGGILLYGSMAPDLVDKYLATEVASSNSDTRNAAAVVWSFNMTEESFKGLAALGEMRMFSSDTRGHVQTVRHYVKVPVTRPAKYSREQILGKIALWPDLPDPPSESDALDNAFYATLTRADLATVRSARRRLITGVSNEAIDAYTEVSRMLMNLVNVLDEYKEYRIH